MKIISIDDRLKCIAGMVSKCNVIADVGTDHGYLPIYLIQNNVNGDIEEGNEYLESIGVEKQHYLGVKSRE